MTQRNSQSCAKPVFTRLPDKAVQVDFRGGVITTDAGLLLLREADRKLDLIRRIDEAILDPRDPRFVLHSQRQMLTSRIFGIAAGYEDGNDHETLRRDPAFQVAADQAPDESRPLASPSTLSRLENRADSKMMFDLHEVIVDTFLKSYDEPPEEIVLDMDATDDPTHGEQDNRYFNGFYRSYCFLPLYVFCGDQMLVSYLRPSRFGAAHHSCAIAKLLVEKIRSQWPDVRIILRGDGGFSLPKLMKWCDKNDVGYVFGLPKNRVLNSQVACEMTRAHMLHTKSGDSEAIFKWFRYRTQKSWDRHRWVVGKAEYSTNGANPRFVVTNLPGDEDIVDATFERRRIKGRQVRKLKEAGTQCSPNLSPEDFYRSMYCLRGEMENRIKEQQLCLFADRTSCTDFMANQLRLLFSSFAYVLLDGIRRLALKGTKAARWRVDTIRLKLIKVAARVVVSARRVVFHLCSNCPYKSEFSHVTECFCDTS